MTRMLRVPISLARSNYTNIDKVITKLSAFEIDILFTLLHKYKNNDTKDKKFKGIKTTFYSLLSDAGKSSAGSNYKLCFAALQALAGTYVEAFFIKNGGKCYSAGSLLSFEVQEDGELNFTLNSAIISYIFESGRFCIVDLGKVLALRGRDEKMLYLLMCSEGKGKRFISIVNIFKTLNIKPTKENRYRLLKIARSLAERKIITFVNKTKSDSLVYQIR